MKCYHITDGHSDHDIWSMRHDGIPLQLDQEGNPVPGTQYLVIHDDLEHCPEPATCIGHPMVHDAVLKPEHVAALAKFGVLSTHNVVKAMLKVAEQWKAAIPQ